MKVVSLKNLAIIYSKGYAYRVHFSFKCNIDATNLLNNSNLNDKGVLQWILVQINLLLK